MSKPGRSSKLCRSKPLKHTAELCGFMRRKVSPSCGGQSGGSGRLDPRPEPRLARDGPFVAGIEAPFERYIVDALLVPPASLMPPHPNLLIVIRKALQQ